MTRAFLGLGSNLGDRREHLSEALRLLSQAVTLCRISSVYETEPAGYREQPLFLNCVAEVSTGLGPTQLLALTREIETRLGRKRSFPNAPRTIDIDILTYGRKSIQTAELTVPHPRLAERGFVLVPLAEIAPRLRPAGSERTIADLAAMIDRQGVKEFGRLDITQEASFAEAACSQ
ncbi:MAG: 2-amino-4-hydroxy-6-hydroxymethyldihydropteridine diphosphokinase [Chloroflexota bacterium]